MKLLQYMGIESCYIKILQTSLDYRSEIYPDKQYRGEILGA